MTRSRLAPVGASLLHPPVGHGGVDQGAGGGGSDQEVEEGGGVGLEVAPPLAPVLLRGVEVDPVAAFTVICFPVKVTHAPAGWTRCVAVLPD